jgi:hypothetical protein
MMLPSTRRSATITGVANNVSDRSRLEAAAGIIGFLRCPLVIGTGSLLYARSAWPGNVPSHAGTPLPDGYQLAQLLCNRDTTVPMELAALPRRMQSKCMKSLYDFACNSSCN